MTVLCVVNPTAGGSGKRLTDKVAAILRSRGAEVVVRETTVRGDAERLARAAAMRDPTLGGTIDVVAVAGGDGTINEVANGLLGSDVTIAVIPSGTANVLAHELGLTTKPAQIAETILNGRAIEVRPGTIGGRCFVAMVGVGFDARAVAAIDLKHKAVIGKGAYALACLPAFFGAPPVLYRVEIDGDAFEAAWIVASKTHFYAGRYVIAPGASLSAASLRIFLLRTPTRFGLIRALVGIGLGRVAQVRDVSLVDGKSVKITRLIGDSGGGTNADPVQADGDAVGHVPVEIGIAAKSVKILTPLGS
jgi:diacylglycerol kinase (ATP)